MRDKVILLRQKLEGSEVRISISESAVAKRKVYKAKFFEESMQVVRKGVIDIIKIFHLEWDMDFLVVYKQDVIDT